MERILEINAPREAAKVVVKAACGTLVIGET